jgi:hypothetical protein
VLVGLFHEGREMLSILDLVCSWSVAGGLEYNRWSSNEFLIKKLKHWLMFLDRKGSLGKISNINNFKVLTFHL